MMVIIPARLQSARLPRKLLLNATGHPLIWHTIQRALSAAHPEQIVVLADDKKIVDAIESYDMGIRTVLTGPAHSGTDRIVNYINIILILKLLLSHQYHLNRFA